MISASVGVSPARRRVSWFGQGRCAFSPKSWVPSKSVMSPGDSFGAGSAVTSRFQGFDYTGHPRHISPAGSDEPGR